MKTNHKSKKVWVYHDQNTPARVTQLTQERKLTITDTLLLHYIGPLVQHSSDGKAFGCFATNKTLAEWADQNQRYVSKRLQHLADLGLLLIVFVNNQRYLELEYSRTADERASLCGEYGEALRRAYKQLLVRVSKPKEGGHTDALQQTDEDQGEYIGRCRGGSTSGDVGGEYIGRCTHNHKDELEDTLGCPPANGECSTPSPYEEEHPSGSRNGKTPSAENGKGKETPRNGKPLPSQNGTTEFPRFNGKPSEHPEEKKPTPPRTFGREFADTVFQKLKKVGKIRITPHLPSWGKEFDGLLSELVASGSSQGKAEKHIRACVTDHLEHINDQYQPKLYAAKTICRDFVRIEDAKKRREEREGPKSTIETIDLGNGRQRCIIHNTPVEDNRPKITIIKNPDGTETHRLRLDRGESR